MKTCPKCGLEYPDTTTLCPADGVALTRVDDALLGQTLAGKYRIEEKLSEGGMGAVYRGTHVLMDKTVAIKVLRPVLAADEKIVARFSREARAASKISHPHALSVTDFGESDGVVFLVMEYLSGKTLKEILRDEGPMPLQRVVDILKQVCDALDAAHAQGVVHRDLKSDNIMLLSAGVGDYTKVLDFGIAKIKEADGEYDASLTAPDLVIGTPQYMSPEQCSQATDIDARSDIYSLGVILYEMLVGHVPFTGGSPTTIMVKHLQEPAPSLDHERPDLPPSINYIVQRAMAKLPDNRYQSAGELVEDLVTAVEVGGPATAVVPPHTEPSGQTVAPSLGEQDDQDEVTVVRARTDSVPPPPAFSPVSRVSVQTYPPETSEPSRFNPWKILVPSLVALIVIFAVIYAFTGGPETTNSAPVEPGLVADPNSQPVEPAQSATGKNEQGIPSGGSATTQTATSNENTNTNSQVDPNAAPSPDLDENVNTNANQQPRGNTNTNSNSNRVAPTIPMPSPTRQENTNQLEPPPPLPSPKTQPQPTTSPEAPDR
jgi:eukaryotic-like serine/threonine-protein kinase